MAQVKESCRKIYHAYQKDLAGALDFIRHSDSIHVPIPGLCIYTLEMQEAIYKVYLITNHPEEYYSNKA